MSRHRLILQETTLWVTCDSLYAMKYFSYIVAVSFIEETGVPGRKPQTCRKSLTNFIKLEPHLVIHVIFDFNQVCILWEKEGHLWL
jgi:hypothetical protein